MIALIIRGRSQCAACNAVLEEYDEVVLLPHFASGPDDPLWSVSDAGFHQRCYDGLPDRPAIEERVAAIHRERQLLDAVLAAFDSPQPLAQLSVVIGAELASGRNREEIQAHLERLRVSALDWEQQRAADQLSEAMEVLAATADPDGQP